MNSLSGIIIIHMKPNCSNRKKCEHKSWYLVLICVHLEEIPGNLHQQHAHLVGGTQVNQYYRGNQRAGTPILISCLCFISVMFSVIALASGSICYPCVTHVLHWEDTSLSVMPLLFVSFPAGISRDSLKAHPLPT